MSGSNLSERAQEKATRRALWVGCAFLLAIGVYWAESSAELLSYLMVVIASLAPAVLWVNRGRAGVPILPAIALLNILYYAFPMVRGREDLSEYSDADILRAAAAVTLYLLMATLAAFLFLRKVRAPEKQLLGLLSDLQLKNVVFFGLALGTVFLAASLGGLLAWLGVFFGLVRSVALTAMVVACYFLGVARGRGVVQGRSWFLSATLLALAVAISWSSLFLVGGLTFLLAVGVGYVTSRGQVPWLALGVAVLLVSILHAGKEEMRNRYWQQGQNTGEQAGLLRLPQLAAEWFETGLEQMSKGKTGRSALDRASLLQILLRVQHVTPGYLDYMRGDSYALVPGMLIPRFFSPGKTKSQAGMDLMNIRYGFLTEEGVEKTAVGWGLITEAYANFGFLGVVGIGLLVGLACGALSRASALAPAVSLSTLMAVAVMVGLINVELDFGGLATSLVQSAAAVFILVATLRLLKQRNRPLAVRPRSAPLAPRSTGNTFESSGHYPR